jgi:negative regulator of flagellin synthesis FlgM
LKIDSSTPAAAAQKPVIARSQDASSSPSAAPASSSRVTLSAGTLTTAQALNDSSSDIDVAKVEQIRSDIAAGKYQIDVSKIADGLIQSASDLLK